MSISPRRALGAALLASTFAAPCALAEACPPEVRVSFPNFEIAPLVLGTDRVETPPGLLVEWTRNALARAGCAPKITILRRPPNRQLAELELGLLDMLPGFSYSAGLGQRMAFPMRDGAVNPDLVLLSDQVSLYARADDARVSWDGHTLESPNPRVGSSTGGALAERLAREHGWQVETAPTPQADLRKLLAKRIDVILEAQVTLAPYLGSVDGAAVRRLEPPVLVTNRYAPVRREFARRYPEFTRSFWLEVCKQSRASVATLPACR